MGATSCGEMQVSQTVRCSSACHGVLMIFIPTNLPFAEKNRKLAACFLKRACSVRVVVGVIESR